MSHFSSSHFLTQFINKKKTLFFLVAFPLSLEKKNEKRRRVIIHIIKRNNGCLFGCFVNCKWNRCVPAYRYVYEAHSLFVLCARSHKNTRKPVLLRKCKQRTAFFFSFSLKYAFFFGEMNGKKRLDDINICSAFNE